MIKQRLPDNRGYFGAFGGRFVPETLVAPLEEITLAFRERWRDARFRRELQALLRRYAGRPTPLTFARRLSESLGPVRIYLKREDLCHTGSHKINNTLGQVLLARSLGKKRIIAETGAGQHGVATATACALLGLPCEIYMGEEDVRRQALNVFRMRLLGARVIPVSSGSKTLKDAINEALRDWVTHVRTTYYVLGSVVGPHPYPWMVREFQSVIGQEARSQIRQAEGRLPHALVACVGGGSNAIGLFHAFYSDRRVRFLGVEAAGRGLRTGAHAASLVAGRMGVLHGAKSFLLQDKNGQVRNTHSISAGLDYPGVGPEHAYYKISGRATYVAATDQEALEGFARLAETEGILPALEPAHAIGFLPRFVKRLPRKAVVIVNVSGRGDKDVEVVQQAKGRGQ